jgi:hypothetical protein
VLDRLPRRCPARGPAGLPAAACRPSSRPGSERVADERAGPVEQAKSAPQVSMPMLRGGSSAPPDRASARPVSWRSRRGVPVEAVGWRTGSFRKRYVSSRATRSPSNRPSTARPLSAPISIAEGGDGPAPLLSGHPPGADWRPEPNLARPLGSAAQEPPRCGPEGTGDGRAGTGRPRGVKGSHTGRRGPESIAGRGGSGSWRQPPLARVYPGGTSGGASARVMPVPRRPLRFPAAARNATMVPVPCGGGKRGKRCCWRICAVRW